MKWIKKRFDGLKLNSKFTIAILMLTAIPLTIFVVTFFQYTRKSIIQRASGEVTEKVAKDYATAQRLSELCNMSSQIFQNNQELRDFLVDLRDQKELSAKEYLNFSKEELVMLEGMVNSNPYLYQIRVYTESDTFPEMAPILYHKTRIQEVPWADSYISGTWQFDYPDFLLSRDDGKHLMGLVTDITDRHGGKIGVLEAAVPMEEMFPEIYASNDETWSCFVLDDGTVCSSQDEEQSCWEHMKEPVFQAAGDLSEKKLIYTKLQNKEVLLAVQPMEELSGTYIYLNSLDQQTDSVQRQQIKVIVILCFLFLALILLVNGTVRALLEKFYDILAVVRQVQQGNVEARVLENGKDEMGEMGNQINRMLDRLQVLMQENVDREVLVKNTEIKALQNQINAHFIYNVLESIKMMAEIDEKYEISDSITALGELLRYNMKWVSGNVTIREEIAYIQNYVQLMNLRYDFTTTLSVKVDNDIYEQKIPKMSLQPIVENAICHGIVEMGEDAVIYIKSIKGEEDFEITITDSGIGMSGEQIELLEKKLRGEVETSGGSGNGIGLKNVQDRIQMQFGEKYGLRFYSKEGCFTKVSLLLPLQKKGNGEKNEDVINS